MNFGPARSVPEQEAMIADLDAISRRRSLSAQESDLLAELVRRAALREWWRKRRLPDQLERIKKRFPNISTVST